MNKEEKDLLKKKLFSLLGFLGFMSGPKSEKEIQRLSWFFGDVSNSLRVYEEAYSLLKKPVKTELFLARLEKARKFSCSASRQFKILFPD